MQGNGAGSRTRVSLDGEWDFRHESGLLRKAMVPGPWQAQFADLRHASGRAVYRRRFPMPQGAGQVVLRFGAVSYFAEVRVNGALIGTNDNGWLPFDCDVPRHLLKQDNELEVLCLLPDGDPATSPEAPFAEIPHGKQSWYGPTGGIWQSVTLELRDPCHLNRAAISADSDGEMGVALHVSPGAAGAVARLAILAPDGMQVAEEMVPAAASVTQANLMVTNPQLWSPDAPNIYSVRVTLERDGAVLDETHHSFGFRRFESRNGQFFLNGKPFYMRAALDQDYYPEGICTPPSMDFIEDQFRKARELGLNMLRTHIKIPDPRYYEAADRLGLLIWTEIPNVATFTAASAQRMKDTMEGIIARDGNHPSIVIWTLINEDWGTRLCEDPSHRAWLAATYDWLKQRDPGRLVVDNSPCHGNFHVKSDIDDFHYYRSVPERRTEWDSLTAEFAARADWTYSPYGDAQRRGDEPLVVSEFGVWGLPHPDQLRLDEAEPWWMETGGTWGDGVAYPHGVQDRFAQLGLSRVFGDFDGFIAAVQGYQFANLKYQIESMRNWPSIQGYVITEFTDVHWESNGLLDMNRNRRSFHNLFGTINADVVILPKPARHSAWAGDTLQIGLAVATGGHALRPCDLHWSVEGLEGVLPVAACPALGVSDTLDLTVQMPSEGPNRMVTLRFELRDAGRTLATNTLSIALCHRPDFGRHPSFGSDDPQLVAWLKDLGLTVAAPDKAAVIVARSLNAQDISCLQDGKKYLVIADGYAGPRLRSDAPRREQPFIEVVDEIPGIPLSQEAQIPNMGLHARHGTIWRGDWIAGFSWVRRDGPLAALPGGPLVDIGWDKVIPHHVLTGFRTWEYSGPVHAGLVVGWCHKPAALIAERRVGRGALVATTFRLLDERAGADPIGTTLTDALLAMAAGLAVE
jgi:hypothetical protein